MVSVVIPAEDFASHDVLVERGAHPDHATKDGLADVSHHTLAKARDQRVAQGRAQPPTDQPEPEPH